MPATIASPSRDPLTSAVGLLDAGIRASHAHARADLVERLTQEQQALRCPEIPVVVVGEFKKGKSSLVNSLVETVVCAVDDDIATSLPTYLRYGDERRAELIHGVQTVRREPIDLAAYRALNSERPPVGGPRQPLDDERPTGIDLRLPAPLLRGGLVLVDTPGVGGLRSVQMSASLAALSMADAAIFVTDASQELTRAEFDFIECAHQMCSRLICVLTKVDFYPEWRTIRDRNARHLAALGDIPLMAVSSTLRMYGLAAQDPDMDDESGIPALADALLHGVVDRRRVALAEQGRADVAAVCDQLVGALKAERAILVDPARAKACMSELAVTRERVDQLRGSVSRWSLTLNDGIADISADIDFDLRARVRSMVHDAEEAIENADPGDIWPEMEAWLEARTSFDVVANYQLLRERANQLNEQVNDHFLEAFSVALGQLTIDPPAGLASQAQISHNVKLQKMGVGKQTMVALRNSYGGYIMFTVLGSLLGLALTPIGLGAGMMMGRRGLLDEKERQLLQRRSQAMTAIRRYSDEVAFVVGKDTRDALRRIHRQLRDHYSARAEELNRSTSQALARATEATDRNENDRRRRLSEIDGELGKLRQLREHACAVPEE